MGAEPEKAENGGGAEHVELMPLAEARREFPWLLLPQERHVAAKTRVPMYAGPRTGPRWEDM